MGLLERQGAARWSLTGSEDHTTCLQVAGESGRELDQEQLDVRVVPLLETLKDLQNAAVVLSDLLAVPWYRNHLR